jgi:uncharacterized protein YecE (DUF72 family)
VPRAEHLAENTDAVHVLMNNCYQDYAVNNAQQLMDLLNSADVDVVPPQG